MKLIAGNWKMHGALQDSLALVKDIKAALPSELAIDVAIMPPFPYLYPIKEHLKGSRIALGAQDLYLGKEGAFTGEVSGAMLKDIGCQYVIVGHSERRQYFHETPTFVGEKVREALRFQLTPILCVGETLEERELNKTEHILAIQLQAVLDTIGSAGFEHLIIAYEPVWAIGTGLSATPDQAQAVHEFIQSWLIKNQVAESKRIRILYGGSVKPDNAYDLFSKPAIDGGLIGGASLNAASFSAICQAAQKLAATT